jgi:hypothetical protein
MPNEDKELPPVNIQVLSLEDNCNAFFLVLGWWATQVLVIYWV